MNLLKKIALVAMTVLMGTGVAVGVGNTLETSVPGDQVAHAASITVGTKLYLQPNSNWKQSNAWFAAYFFNSNSDNGWAKCVQFCETCNIYEVTVPTKNWNKMIFVRMNDSKTELSWDSKWNQTGDLVWDGSKKLFVVPDGAWDGSTTGWYDYNITSWTGGKNYCLKPLSSYGWTSDNAWFAAHFYNNSTKKSAWVKGVEFKEDSSTFYNFTAPQGVWNNVILTRMDPSKTALSWDSKWNETDKICLCSKENQNYSEETGSFGNFTHYKEKYSALTLSLDILESGSCKASENSYYNSEFWPNFEISYSLLDDKDTLKNTIADANSEDILQKAMAKYDSNVKNNGANNFINRNISTSGLGYQLFNTNNDSSNYLLIGFVAISLLIGFVIFFKNKKQRNY